MAEGGWRADDRHRAALVGGAGGPLKETKLARSTGNTATVSAERRAQAEPAAVTQPAPRPDRLQTTPDGPERSLGPGHAAQSERLGALQRSPRMLAQREAVRGLHRSPAMLAQRRHLQANIPATGARPLVQRIAGDALDAVTRADELENLNLERATAIGAARNEFAAEIEGTTSRASERRFNIQIAQELGQDLGSTLKDLNQKHGRGTRAQRADAFHNALLERIAEVVNAYDKAVLLMTGLGVTADNTEKLYLDLLHAGRRPNEIDQALKTIQSQHKKAFKEKGDPLAFLTGYFNEKRGALAVQIDPRLFKPQKYARSAVDRLVVDSAARAKEHGTTIEGNAYVARHFTGAVMKFLAGNAGVPIHIFEGAVSGALGLLAQSGYTEVRPLSDNDFTDFRKFTARKPDSGDTVFVVVGPSGRAYQREIAAHFLYHDPPIDPKRISHFVKGDQAAKQEFVKELDQLGVDPDVVLMGNVAEVKSKLSERSITPAREIVSPNLYGVLYQVNKLAMLSLKVEPHLYADRAGAFLEAVQSRSTKQRHVIFTGTAGGFEEFMKINDLVAPQTLNQSDTLENSPSTTPNLAADYFAQHHGKAEGMFSKDMKHGAVDTILFEDNKWLEAHRKEDKHHLSIVEQEVGGLAKAVDSAHTTLSAFFRISDLPGRQDFTENEVNRPPPRTPVSQGDLVIGLLQSLLKTDKLTDTAEHPGKPKLNVSTKGQEMVFKTAEKAYTLATKSYEVMGRLDPKVARELDTAIRELIAQFQADKFSASQFATRLTRLHEVYGLVPDLASKHLPTAFTLQRDTLGPLTLQLSDPQKRITMHALELTKRATHWSLTLEILPKGERFDYKLYDKTSNVKEGVVTGGENKAL